MSRVFFLTEIKLKGGKYLEVGFFEFYKKKKLFLFLKF